MRETNFAFYVDDNTLYITAENLDDVFKSLEENLIKLFYWFPNNQMKANQDKCYLLISGKNCVTINVNGFETENTEYKKLLGINVDCELRLFKKLVTKSKCFI